MKEFYYEKNGLYYRKNEFKEDRNTVILVHGLSGSSKAWVPYEKKFEDKFNIVSLDLRGHGKSKKFPKYGDYEIKKFADDINFLLEYLGINKFIFVSHSLGTLIVFEFIALYGEKVEGTIFLSPNYNIKNRLISNLIRPLLWPVPLLDLFPFTPKIGGHIDYDKYKHKADWDLRRMYEDISNTYLRIYLYCIKQSYNVDYENLLNRIKMPTLIIHGKSDTIFPVKNAMLLSKKIENSKLILIERGNHLIIFNNIPEVSGQIEEFITSKF